MSRCKYCGGDDHSDNQCSDPPPSSPVIADTKTVYVKRWRTLVKLPAKYADEIVEALREPARSSAATVEPVAYRWRYDGETQVLWGLRIKRPKFADDPGVICEPLFTHPAQTSAGISEAVAPMSATEVQSIQEHIKPQVEATRLRNEISECWETLEKHGFPPEACGWPFKSIVGGLPNAVDSAIDCLVRQRQDLQAEVGELRAGDLAQPSPKRACNCEEGRCIDGNPFPCGVALSSTDHQTVYSVGGDGTFDENDECGFCGGPLPCLTHRQGLPPSPQEIEQ